MTKPTAKTKPKKEVKKAKSTEKQKEGIDELDPRRQMPEVC